MSEPPARRLWLTRLTGAAALLLVGATWPLWAPPSPDSFPQLPLLAWLIPAPAWCDRVALGGLLIGAAGMLLTPASGGRQPPERWKDRAAAAARFAPGLLFSSLAFACLLNQIRLQVWAYQFLLLGGVLALCPRTETGDRAAVTLARVLAVGILFHSALSKLDLAFAEGPGRWLIGGFLGLFGADAGGLDADLVGAAAFAVPAWELGLSGLLAVPGLRRAGLIGAVLMHAAVTATLWRLDQSWGVILWNLFFLTHEFVLFWPEAKSDRVPLSSVLTTAGPRAWPAAGLIAAALLLPFGTRAGYWDVWPGWAVYAGGVPKVTVQKTSRFIMFTEGMYTPDEPIDLGDRGLAALRAPVPQDPRVRLGLLSAFSRRGDLLPADDADRWLVQYWEEPPGPRFRRPARRAFPLHRTKPDGIESEPGRFLLNARPRTLSLPPDAR